MVPVVDVGKSNTTYADDFHFAWAVHSIPDFDKAYNAARHVLQSLHSRGLQISTDKTVIILDIRGKQAKKALRRYMVKTSQGKRIRFQFGEQCLDLKIVTSHTYLGAKISFRKFEAETAQHRMQLARGSYNRLRNILRCQAVPLKLRIRLWHSCILPCLLRSLDCTGVTDITAAKIRSLVTQQLRQITKSYSMFTLEANEDLLIRLKIEDPIDTIYKAFVRCTTKPHAEYDELQVWESHGQWLSTLRGRFYDNSEAASQGAWGARAGPESKTSSKARIMPVHLVAEHFACNECGFSFATQAALKAHKFKMHYEEDDKKARQQEIIQRKQSQATERARNGLPTCRHCGHDFETWPAFTYHVNSRNCPEIRHFFSQPDCQRQLAELQGALTF